MVFDCVLIFTLPRQHRKTTKLIMQAIVEPKKIDIG